MVMVFIHYLNNIDVPISNSKNVVGRQFVTGFLWSPGTDFIDEYPKEKVLICDNFMVGGSGAMTRVHRDIPIRFISCLFGEKPARVERISVGVPGSLPLDLSLDL